MKKYDVIIAGGGMAGVGAAVAAAREGVSVLLIDKCGSLGGAATDSLVLPFMRYFTDYTDNNGNEHRLYTVRGIFTEIMDRIKSMNAGGEYSYFATFNTEYLKVILEQMVIEAGADILYHTTVTAVNKNERKINSVEVFSTAGKMHIEADCFIDCTGDANLSMLSGCSYRLGREEDGLCQPMTLCFRVVGVDTEDIMRNKRPEMQKLYKKFKAAGKITNPRENLLMFRTDDNRVIHFNTTRIVKLDPTDPFDLTKAEIEGRRQMIEIFEFLKENFEYFKDAKIVSSAASIGIRESRMVEGEHVLTGDELVQRIVFDDAIAAGNYDIDIHNPVGEGTEQYFFPQGTYYTIPFRSLVARDMDNLFIAGRCISCDHRAQSSIRIMPICCAMGQAAGVGAAVAVKNKCAAKNADIKEIQKILKQNNVFF